MTSPVVHFDVFGPDEDALRRFYGDLLGWQVDAKGPGYALVRTPDGSPDGAIVAGEAAGLSLGVSVADLDAAVARVAEAGGTVELPPTDNGWVVKARVRDPAGNVITLIQG